MHQVNGKLHHELPSITSLFEGICRWEGEGWGEYWMDSYRICTNLMVSRPASSHVQRLFNSISRRLLWYLLLIRKHGLSSTEADALDAVDAVHVSLVTCIT